MVLVGKVTFAGDDDILYDDADAFLDCIREELPYRDTTGFRYEVLTDDPGPQGGEGHSVRLLWRGRTLRGGRIHTDDGRNVI